MYCYGISDIYDKDNSKEKCMVEQSFRFKIITGVIIMENLIDVFKSRRDIIFLVSMLSSKVEKPRELR